MQRGITLLEILVSVAILAALSLVGVWYFSSATKSQALQKDRQGVVALLSEARSLSLSSKDASPYGVHIEEFQVVLFKGTSYSAGASDNIPYQLHSAVHVDAHSLQDSGDDLVFSRLTGAVTNFGTIRISLKSDSMSSTTITVKDTGVIE
ncbi:MAG: type II secretion system protein [Patescibacteria group bacterium]